MYIGFLNDQKELKVLIQQEKILSVKTKKRRKRKYVVVFLVGTKLAFAPFNDSAKPINYNRASIVTLANQSSFSSVQDPEQSLPAERSTLKFSDDEFKALGFAKSDDNPKEVTLVVGIPIPHSSKQTLSGNPKNLIRASNVPIDIEKEPKVLLQKMSYLKNSDWIDNFISSLRGGKRNFRNLDFNRLVL